MFWNLYGTFTLVITLFSSIKHTSNSPLHSRDYVNSIDHSKFDNINNEDLLVHDVLPYIPTSVEPSSSSWSSSSLLLPTIGSVSSSISSIPNEEEILRLQLALALQIDSEVNKAIHLENAASESIQQADLLNKAADEAKYRAQLVGQILNSLKQSWNTTNSNNNNDNIIDNFSNDDNIHEKRAFIEVPKINQDYLLDEEVGGQIITDYNDNNREKRNQDHREHHHHQQQQQHQRYENMKKKRNLFPVPDPHNELHVQHLYDYPLHEYIEDDDDDDNDGDDDDDKNMILNDSEQNIKKQLTLEKIRLLILRQLIKQQRESKEKEKEKKEKKDYRQHHLYHYDHSRDNNHNDYLQLDKNVIPLHMINQYPNLYIDRRIWKELHNQYDN
ncbi:unnamed protein product, partial [Schistosoma mattheei]|uniref:Uncharacterized protein n=1 Tax=Schistosoma mattheei TaxID=31246 RepID=A0AA85B1E5_9TREM